jgi:glycosyltransferase involved in cell wall biosynthesis
MRTIFISHNAVNSALVRSQVLPYLRRLAREGIETWLITFERGAGLFPEAEFTRERWIGISAHGGSHLLAKLLDVIRGTWLALRLARRIHADAVHAVSYVPAAIALGTGMVTRLPFVFDMRGFLGDEYIEAGHWTQADVRYRVLRLAEGVLLRGAAELIVRTHDAAARLRGDRRYGPHVDQTPITVIPAAVDLDRFRPSTSRSEIPTLVYAGSLGTWYRLDEMLRVYAYARKAVPKLRFLILNHDEHSLVDQSRQVLGLSQEDVIVRTADYAEMPALLAGAHVGIVLLLQSESKLASSPIKVGEYLASGLPVIVNTGMGDTDGAVQRYAAGHVVPSYSDDSLQAAAAALVALLGDETARKNARALAEAEFDLRDATSRYTTVYQRLECRRAAPLNISRR